jgi:hypothetical protein
MVFKLADDGFNQLDFPFQEASISISVRASNSTRRVCLEGYMEEDGDDGVLISTCLYQIGITDRFLRIAVRCL